MAQMTKYNGWMNPLFDDLFSFGTLRKPAATVPAINIAQDEKAYYVEVAAAGMSKGDFRLNLDDENNLVLHLERQEREEAAEKKYVRREFAYTKFEQKLILPEDVNKDAISAKMADGVLEITLPRLTPEQKQQTMRHIEIL